MSWFGIPWSSVGDYLGIALAVIKALFQEENRAAQFSMNINMKIDYLSIFRIYSRKRKSSLFHTLSSSYRQRGLTSYSPEMLHLRAFHLASKPTNKKLHAKLLSQNYRTVLESYDRYIL